MQVVSLLDKIVLALLQQPQKTVAQVLAVAVLAVVMDPLVTV
jgi:hypothetical protein